MRILTGNETALVSGGLVSMGDVFVGGNNGIGNGNRLDVENVGNCNSILNDNLNGSANGWGIGNYSSGGSSAA